MDGVDEVMIDKDVVEGRKEPIRVYAEKARRRATTRPDAAPADSARKGRRATGARFLSRAAKSRVASRRECDDRRRHRRPCRASRLPWWTIALSRCCRSGRGAASGLPSSARSGVGRRRGDPDRCGARGGASCRGRRAPRRRTVRHAGARDRGDGDRGVADRQPDAVRCRRCVGARARHGVRGDHDHPERHRRAVPARRRAAAPRAAVLAARGQRGAERAGRDVGADAGPAQLRRERAGADLCAVATDLRRDRQRDPLRDLRAGADGAAPQLFPARGRRADDARRPADRPHDLDRVRRCCWSRWSASCCWPRGWRRRSKARCSTPACRWRRRGRDRGAGARARKPGGVPRGAAQPVADQPQSRARLGAGDDRADDPERSRSSRCSSGCRWRWASARRA